MEAIFFAFSERMTFTAIEKERILLLEKKLVLHLVTFTQPPILHFPFSSLQHASFSL